MSWVDVTSAVGTAGAAVIALGLGARGEWRTMRAERQLRAEREREQASRISGWPATSGSDGTRLALMNGSAEPVYEVVVTMVMIQGAGPHRGEDHRPEHGSFRRTLGVLPPGSWHVSVGSGWAGMNRRPGVELAFTDRRGNHWIRRATGLLEAISEPPIDYYKMGRPQELGIPESG